MGQIKTEINFNIKFYVLSLESRRLKMFDGCGRFLPLPENKSMKL